MKTEFEILESEVLDSIQPFSGVPVRGNVSDQVILSGGTMMQTRTAYTTAVAVQQPRSIAKIANNVLEEARLAGKSFFYRWPVKNSDGTKGIVEGASIDLAMAMCRHYGNAAIEVEATETPTHYLMKGIFIDLESGFTCPRLFRQRKSQRMGKKMDVDRQEDIVFQIGQSKAIRNAVIKAMPEWLVDRAIEVATEAELNKAKKENIHLARQKVIEWFGQYGVPVDRIEAERKRPVDQWTPDDIVDLRGMATALKEGRASGDELFPSAQAETPVDKPAPKQAPVETGAPAQQPAPSVPDDRPSRPEPPPPNEVESPAPRTRAPRKKPEQAVMTPPAAVRENGPAELTPDEKALMSRFVEAKNEFQQEYAMAFDESGLKPGQAITPDAASWILQRINQILDEQM